MLTSPQIYSQQSLLLSSNIRIIYNIRWSNSIFRTPIIFRQPSLSTVSDIFFLPFDNLVWYCYATITMCIIIILTIQSGHPLIRFQFTFFDTISLAFGAICQQGTHLTIPTTSGRFVLMTTFLATLAMFSSYSASIVSLIQSPSKSIQNLDNLIESPLGIGMHAVEYIERKVFAENDTILRQLFQVTNQESDYIWIEDELIGIDKVRNELFGFLIDAPIGYQAISKSFTESEKCRLNELKVMRQPMNTITVHKRTGLKEPIKQR